MPTFELGLLINRLRTGSLRAKFDAALKLEALGVKAKPAIPALAELISKSRDCVHVSNATRVLCNIGNEGVSAIIWTLQLATPWRASIIIFTLLMSESKEKAYAPHLVRFLGNRKFRVHFYASDMLGKIGEGAICAIPRLTQMLRNKNRLVGLHAASAILRIKPTPMAVEIVRLALMDEKLETQESACYVLRYLGTHEKNVLSRAKQMLQNSSPLIRLNSAESFIILNHYKEEATGTILALLSSNEQSIRSKTIDRLAKMGAHAKRFYFCLSNMMDKANGNCLAPT